MHIRRTIIALSLGIFFINLGYAENKLPFGSGSIEFTPDAKKPDKTIKVWTNQPKATDANTPIVIVMHGNKRNGETYRDNWKPHSESRGFLLIVPEFPEDQYPGLMYHRGNIVDDKGKPNDPKEWTYTTIEKLFDHVKAITGNKNDKYSIYGHSAGGQFVHRFIMFMPDARYHRAIAANPGYYTFPTQDAKYPYGLKGTHIAQSLSPKVFARDFVLLLGEADTNRDDPDLLKTAEADAQGMHRFERGNNYYKTAKTEAEKLKAKFNWQVVTVPGVGHSDAKMSKSAAEQLFK